jgi:hypothetical protein
MENRSRVAAAGDSIGKTASWTTERIDEKSQSSSLGPAHHQLSEFSNDQGEPGGVSPRILRRGIRGLTALGSPNSDSF